MATWAICLAFVAIWRIGSSDDENDLRKELFPSELSVFVYPENKKTYVPLNLFFSF